LIKFNYNSTVTAAPLVEIIKKNDSLLQFEANEKTLINNKSMKIQSKESGDSGLLDISDISGQSEFSSLFCEYANQRRVLLGCEPILYITGLMITTPIFTITIPPGRFETILFFICHNHPLFRCFYGIETRFVGLHGVRFIFIAKEIVGFVLFQFSHMLLNYWKLNIFGIGTFVNLFVIAPSMATIGVVITHLYSCPMIETIHFQEKFGHYEKLIRYVGLFAIFPIIILMGISLIMACMFRYQVIYFSSYLISCLYFIIFYSVMVIEFHIFL